MINKLICMLMILLFVLLLSINIGFAQIKDDSCPGDGCPKIHRYEIETRIQELEKMRQKMLDEINKINEEIKIDKEQLHDIDNSKRFQ